MIHNCESLCLSVSQLLRDAKKIANHFLFRFLDPTVSYICVCVCVCVCVCACVHACLRACVRGYIWSDNSKRSFYYDIGVKLQALLEFHKYIEKFTVKCNNCCHVNAINLLYEGFNKVLRDSSVQFLKMFSGNST